MPGEPGELQLSSSYRWVILALAISTTAIGFMVWAAPFALLNVWIRDLGISHTQGGVLFILYYLPGIVVSLPGGLSFDRYPLRHVFLASWSLFLAGTVMMAVAPNFLTLCAGRLLFSIGFNVHLVGAPKLVASWFEGRRELGFVMGLYTWGYTVGIFSSLVVLGSLAQNHGWREAMYVLVLLVGLGMSGLAILVRPAQLATLKTSPQLAPLRADKLGIAIWLVALMSLFYNAGSDSYYTFTPDYLVHRGYTLARASTIVGMYAWVAFFLKPLFASLLTRSRAAWFVVLGSVVEIAAFLLLLPKTIYPVVTSTLVGFSIALTMPSLLALPALLLSSERAGKGYGLCQLSSCLGFFAQPLIGYSIDRTGQFYWGYAQMSFYCVLALISAIVLGFVTKTSVRNGAFNNSIIKS